MKSVGEVLRTRRIRSALRFAFLLLPVALAFFVLVFGTFLWVRLDSSERELALVRAELAELQTATLDAIAAQSSLLEQQTADLSRQDEVLKSTQANEELLQEALAEVREAQSVEAADTSGTDRALIAALAPAIVKLSCIKDGNGSIQRGTGVLFRGGAYDPFGEYYIQTNLHVVETTDESRAHCVITLYPDSGDVSEHLVFESDGFKYYGDGIDIAFLTPKVVDATEHAGTTDDLARYARSRAETPTCSALATGDRISILGYPAAGGDTLTVTDGIVSGFETEGEVRYVKTSAKIDIGNSGGAAIEESGCIVGIPTSVRQSRLQTIGRILDLHYLFNVTLR